MMKKLSSKQIFIYVALGCVLILVLVYMLVYQKNIEKAEALRASNETLQRRVDSLKTYYDNEAQYLEDMEPMKTEIDEVLAKYPANILEEDVIMQAVITQKTTPMEYNVINIKEQDTLQTINESVVQGAGVEKYQQEIVFEARSASYANTLDYQSLKMAVQSLFDSEYNIGISGITYAKDPGLGELSGTVDLIFYSVSGAGKEYTVPNIMPYLAGTTDIFFLVDDEEEEE